MARPKTTVLEREIYTKVFFAVAYKKVRTSKDLHKYMKGKGTRENYSIFLRNLSEVNFLRTKPKFGKYYKYEVNWEFFFKFTIKSMLLPEWKRTDSYLRLSKHEFLLPLFKKFVIKVIKNDENCTLNEVSKNFRHSIALRKISWLREGKPHDEFCDDFSYIALENLCMMELELQLHNEQTEVLRELLA